MRLINALAYKSQFDLSTNVNLLQSVVKILDAKIQENIQIAVESIKNGNLVIYPTETCYGIAALANDKIAITKLLKYKQRPPGKAISINLSDSKKIGKFVNISNSNWANFEKFLPGPITIVSKSLGLVDNRIENPDGSLGIRVSSHIVANQLALALDLPFTATSANIAAKPNPYSLEQWQKQTPLSKQNQIDIFLDFGELVQSPPSLVINLANISDVYREGALDNLDIEKGQVFNAENQVETIKVAKFIAKSIANQQNVLFKLYGDMGSGKTTLTGYLMKELEYLGKTSSPTYTIVNEYRWENQKNSSVAYHIDLWKTSSSKLEMLIEPKFSSINKVIIFVEWSEKLIESEMQNKFKIYRIKIINQGSEKRRFIFTQID